MNWENQNAEQWKMIDFVLQGQSNNGVLWLTCDQFQHREMLQQDFQTRFPQFSHTIARVDGFEGGSLADYLKSEFEKSGGNLDSKTTQIFHITGLERYLLKGKEIDQGDFFAALNFERPIFYQSLPFLLVFWTDSHCLIQTHRLAADFWEWLTNKYHFEAPEIQLPPNDRRDIEFNEKHWVVPTEEETERLHNRNARLIASLELQKTDQDRRSIWIGLADNFFKLRDFENSIRYRKMAIDSYGIENKFRQKFQTGVLARTYIFQGQQYAFLGNLDAARDSYEKVLKECSNNGMNFQCAFANQCLGELYLLSSNLEEAEKHAIESVSIFKNIGSNVGLGHAYMNLGKIEVHKNKDLKTAEKLFQLAERAYQEEGEKINLVNVKIALSNLNGRLGKFDNAKKILFEAIEIGREVNDERLNADIFLELGKMHLVEKNYDYALVEFEKANEIFRRAKEIGGQVLAIANIAIVNNLEKRYDKRDKVFSEAKKLAIQLGRSNINEWLDSISANWDQEKNQ